SKKTQGFGAVEMYDGKREGAKKGFYAEICRDNQCYVFGSWADLDAFRKSGDTSTLSKADVTGPAGEAVMVAQPSETLIERFKTVHAK
ncbi:MAG: hypothetical protein ACREIB_06415, partial [Pseudomonadota bacterium]